MWTHAVLRLPKLLRLLRVLVQFFIYNQFRIIGLLQYMGIIYKKASYFIIFPSNFLCKKFWSRNPKLAGGICLLSHWIGCIYIVLSRYEKYSTSWTPDIEIVESGFGDFYLYIFLPFFFCLSNERFAIMWAVRVVTGVGGKEVHK